MSALSDEELARLLEQDPDQFEPGMLSIAEEEAASRGGLDQLRTRAAGTRNDQVDPAPGESSPKPMRLADGLISTIIGQAQSDRFPALAYLSIALRLLAFLVGGATATLALTEAAQGNLIASFGGMLATVIGLIILLVPAAALFGASELIRVLLQIEQNTRQGRSAGVPEQDAD